VPATRMLAPRHSSADSAESRVRQQCTGRVCISYDDDDDADAAAADDDDVDVTTLRPANTD
jgi:hypothetical protein